MATGDRPGMADFLIRNSAEIIVFGQGLAAIMNAVKGKKVPETAPDWAKTAADAISNIGGPDSFLDEDTFDRVTTAVQVGSADESKYYFRWSGFEFPLSHADPWMRKQAKEGHEIWRQYITFKVVPAKMGVKKVEKVLKRDRKDRPIETETSEEEHTIRDENIQPAVNFISQIGKDVIQEIEAVAKERKLSKTTISTMSERQIQDCQPEAFVRVTHNLQQNGATWMPEPDEKPLASRVQEVLKSVGPASSSAAKTATEKVSDAVGYSGKKLNRTARLTRASEYLAKRQHRQAKANRGRIDRLRDWIIQSL